MEFYELFGFVSILSESIKLLPKNGKLMGFIVALAFVLPSSLFLLYNYTLQSLLFDMFVSFQQSFMPNPSSFNVPDPEDFNDPSFDPPKSGFDPTQITSLLGLMRKDLSLILASQLAYFLAITIVSFFFSFATIIVSSMSYNAMTLSPKDLLSRIGTTWAGPMITMLYVSCLAIGYFFLVVMLVSPLMMYPSFAAFWVAILLGFVASVVYLYLFVVWGVAIVVSVVEEGCYGTEALGKAYVLVKGKRLHGFILNICFNLIVLTIFMVCKILLHKRWFVNPKLSGLVLMNVSFLVTIFMVVAYTVLYFQCKKHRGEEVELQGHVRYTKLSISQLGSDMA